MQPMRFLLPPRLAPGGLFLTIRAEAVDLKVMLGDLEAALALELGEGLRQGAAIQFAGAVAAFAMNVVMVLGGATAKKALNLVIVHEGLCPAFLDEPFQVPVDCWTPRARQGEALEDLIHREWTA